MVCKMDAAGTPKVGFLKVSAVQDKKIKKIAMQCNTPNGDDLINTPEEWKALMEGIADAFGRGAITYKTAKKYADMSSSVFVQKDEKAKAYKDAYDESLLSFHHNFGSTTRLGRRLSKAVFRGDNKISNIIKITADIGEADAKIAELDAKNAELDAKNAELDAKNAELDAEIAVREEMLQLLNASIEKLNTSIENNNEQQ